MNADLKIQEKKEKSIHGNTMPFPYKNRNFVAVASKNECTYYVSSN
jgi:hypothetical protein